MFATRKEIMRRATVCALAAVLGLAVTTTLAPATTKAAGQSGGTHKNEEAYKKKMQECNTYGASTQQFKDCVAQADQL